MANRKIDEMVILDIEGILTVPAKIDTGKVLQPTIFAGDAKLIKKGMNEHVRAGETVIFGDVGYELSEGKKYRFEKMFTKEQTKEEVKLFPWEKM